MWSAHLGTPTGAVQSRRTLGSVETARDKVEWRSVERAACAAFPSKHCARAWLRPHRQHPSRSARAPRDAARHYCLPLLLPAQQQAPLKIMPRKNAEPKGPPETVDLLDSDDDEPVVVNGKRREGERKSRRIADKPGEEKQMLTFR